MTSHVNITAGQPTVCVWRRACQGCQLTQAERISIVSANGKGVKFGILNDMGTSCCWVPCKKKPQRDMPSELRSTGGQRGSTGVN
ncbi:hypothetical protein Hamer_G011679 [Homarus americanus]|uniref:Uncharacterized protein n=1 Tax=Homarus americanus TaxID=6706 RepID=A0A8J5KA93_HOMAM|nr:hypothetical protein Hamer_G011679 [Homarus americanus]